MKNDYSTLLNFLGKYNSIEEDDHIYFVPQNYICNNDMLIQELDDNIIIWDNQIKEIDEYSLYKFISENYNMNIIWPFIDSFNLLDAVKRLGAVQTEFHDEQEASYKNIYGSYILVKKKG